MKSTHDPLGHVLHLIHQYFIWLIIASYVVAAVLPGLGLWLRHAELGPWSIFGSKLTLSLPPLMLASLLFNAGLGMKSNELKHLLRRPLVLLAGLAGNVAAPLVFIAVLSVIMKLWHNSEEVQHILVGLALVASMPIAGSSTAWSQNANGNLTLSLGLVLLTTLLSPMLTPIALHFAGLLTTGDYSEDLHELASGDVGSFLGAWVILPSLLGIVVNRVAGEQRVARAMPVLKLINYGVLLLLNYLNAALSLPKAVFEPDFDFLAVMLLIAIALCVFAFGAGYGLARAFRSDRDATVSLMFGLGMNNNGTGLVLASLALADHPQVMLPIIFYNLVQHFVAAAVDFAMFRRPAIPPTTSDVSAATSSR